MRSTTELRPREGRGRIRTFDLTIGEVTALFTTGKRDRWGTVDIGFSLPGREPPRVATKRPDPRHAGPRGTGSTARRGDWRDSNPLYLERSNRSLHHQRTFGRRSTAAISDAAIKRRDKYQTSVAALSINGAPPSEPCGSPRHRWTARSPRAPFPPAGPALLDRRAKGCARSRDPGLPFRQSGGISDRAMSEGDMKNPSGAAAREGFGRTRTSSVPVSRSISHETGARSPTASRRAIDLRCFAFVFSIVSAHPGADGMPARAASILANTSPVKHQNRNRTSGSQASKPPGSPARGRPISVRSGAEHALERVPELHVDLGHRGEDAEVGEAGHALLADAAGDDAGEVVEHRIDVERDPVERHPAADADADRGDLVLAAEALFRARDPDADPVVAPLALDVETGERADDPCLERGDEAAGRRVSGG